MGANPVCPAVSGVTVCCCKIATGSSKTIQVMQMTIWQILAEGDSSWLLSLVYHSPGFSRPLPLLRPLLWSFSLCHLTTYDTPVKQILSSNLTLCRSHLSFSFDLIGMATAQKWRRTLSMLFKPWTDTGVHGNRTPELSQEYEAQAHLGSSETLAGVQPRRVLGTEDPDVIWRKISQRRNSFSDTTAITMQRRFVITCQPCARNISEITPLFVCLINVEFWHSARHCLVGWRRSLPPPFYPRRSWDTETFTDSPNVTQLLSDRTRIWTRIY